MTEYSIFRKEPHPRQAEFINSQAKRKVIRAGRRGGKTTGIAILAVDAFLDMRRVLYAAPTQEQVEKFWTEIKHALQEPIDAGPLHKNETLHVVEIPGTETRIRAKTAWNADTLRGDYADLLILDEYQLMDEEAWGRVGAPMLLDNDGDAVFIYTPPSLLSRSRTKARDPRHAAKMFARAAEDTTGRWATFHFASHDNPHISEEALAEISQDMTRLAYEQEILALDKDEAPGALWTHILIDGTRLRDCPPLERIVIGVDPPGSALTECGIVAAGIALVDGERHAYVIGDKSRLGSPGEWSTTVIDTYGDVQADRVVAEVNYGGEMVESTLRTAEGGRDVSYKAVHASRGKQIRAEPIAALYERGLVHHVGAFPHLEDEMCTWVPGEGMPSPNRMDALVWALADLMLGIPAVLQQQRNPFYA